MQIELEFHPVDILVIIAYFIATLSLGFWVSRNASKNLDSYFLGNKSMPWWVLGVSNASGMFDITGTMWLVYIVFVYGMKSVWLPWLWPVFNQIFLMIFLSTWLRRSNVLTGAEWIRTRFGSGTGANLAHISIVVFALVSVVGFLAYEFKGMGKFASIFLPWDLSPNTYALIILGITTIYVVKGGMFSVVLTEVMQFFIMTVSSIVVGVIAMMRVAPDTLDRLIPDGWKTLWFGWSLNLDWTQTLQSVNAKIAADGYELFTIFFMMLLFKGVLVSMAGPAPNYDMQRILATRNPREASLMSGFVSVVLFFPRYMMISGLVLLAMGEFIPQLQAMGDKPDFELILPYAIKNFIPIGLMGLLVAGLLSAFMSTFAATVNAAPAYIVNDIYKRFIDPHAEPKKYVRMSYVTSVLVVVIGIGFGFIVDSIDDVMQWIVNALWAGYAASNILKWYWWRFNGYGFFWGMVTGIGGALIVPIFWNVYCPNVHEIYAFPIILLFSLVGSVLGTLLTQPTGDEDMKSFYSRVRPWGFWKPVHEMVVRDNPEFKGNQQFGRDCFNVLIGVIWQTSLVILPMCIVFRITNGIWISLAVAAVTTVVLKFNWYDKLEEEI